MVPSALLPYRSSYASSDFPGLCACWKRLQRGLSYSAQLLVAVDLSSEAALDPGSSARLYLCLHLARDPTNHMYAWIGLSHHASTHICFLAVIEVTAVTQTYYCHWPLLNGTLVYMDDPHDVDSYMANILMSFEFEYQICLKEHWRWWGYLWFFVVPFELIFVCQGWVNWLFLGLEVSQSYQQRSYIFVLSLDSLSLAKSYFARRGIFWRLYSTKSHLTSSQEILMATWIWWFFQTAVKANWIDLTGTFQLSQFLESDLLYFSWCKQSLH